MIDDKIWIASFDLGKINFAFTIEELDIKCLKSIKNIPKDKRYNPNGTCTPIFEELLCNLYKTGKVILIKNINLTKNCSGDKKYTEQDVFHNMIDCLDEYKKDYWDKVSYFVIEKQMKINQSACRLSMVCMSYFMFNYGRFRQVIEFNSYYKTTILGAKRDTKKLKNGKVKFVSTTKNERKKWAVEKAVHILSEREDFEIIQDIMSNGKKDDKCDVLCQLQAFKYLEFIDK